MGPLVESFFLALEEEYISWAILRNAKGLPEFTRYDVDILVDSKHAGKVEHILRKKAEEQKWCLVGIIRKRAYCCHVYRSPGKNPQYLPFDIFCALEYRGVRFAETTDVLQLRKRTAEGVWELPVGASAAITLLKELLPHQTLKENSRPIVNYEATREHEGFLQQLAKSGLPTVLAKSVTVAVRESNWDELDRLAPSCIEAIRKTSPRKALRRSDMFIRNLLHFLRPCPGMHIVLIGPDGCGKTTLAGILSSRLFKRPFKAIRYIHGNFGILPRFRDIKARLLGKQLEEPEPGEIMAGMVETLPAWKSCALAAYYALDHFLGRPVLRRWKAQWSLVLSDRSFYDYYFQRGHGDAPSWFLHLSQQLVPEPDLILVINRDADVIYEAKPELSVTEIRREQMVIETLLRNNPKAVWINGNAGVAEATRQAEEAILNAVQEKFPT